MITRLKAAVAAEVGRVRRRLMRQAAFGTAAAGLFLCALGFLLAACYMVLARQIGDVQAALIVAGGLIVVALGLFLAMDSGAESAETRATLKANLERAKLEATGDRAEAAGTVSGIVGAIAQELDGPTRDALIAGAKAAPKLTPVQLMMIAAAAGFFYGRRARRD